MIDATCHAYFLNEIQLSTAVEGFGCLYILISTAEKMPLVGVLLQYREHANFDHIVQNSCYMFFKCSTSLLSRIIGMKLYHEMQENLLTLKLQIFKYFLPNV